MNRILERMKINEVENVIESKIGTQMDEAISKIEVALKSIDGLEMTYSKNDGISLWIGFKLNGKEYETSVYTVTK